MLTSYALGLLGEPERREVEAYLEGHPEVAANVRAEQEALTALVFALPPEPAPAGDADRLMARLHAERAAEAPTARAGAARRRLAWPWTLAVAAAVALATLAVWPGVQTWQSQRTLSQYQDQPGASSQALRAGNGQTLGTLVRLPNGRAYVQLAAEPEAGRVYQAWSVRGAVITSLGVFDGRQILTPPLTGGGAFAVSVEPPGGSEQPTTTPIVVQPLS